MKIIGVRFREVGKIHYYNCGDDNFEVGDRVIVESERGIECGRVIVSPREVSDNGRRVEKVIRKADDEDLMIHSLNLESEREAFDICKAKIIEFGLPMKLICAEFTFDKAKVIFYFTSEGRVDFRELVRVLAGIFKNRIELRQVGVRDETRMVGGFGSCGRELCCSSYLSDFAPVSIKMAKDQNMSLNPVKISGVCGRLMCCLKNEETVYEELNAKVPREGDIVELPTGESGNVISVNVLLQNVRVLVAKEDGEKLVESHHATELKMIKRKYRYSEQKNV